MKRKKTICAVCHRPVKDGTGCGFRFQNFGTRVRVSMEVPTILHIPCVIKVARIGMREIQPDDLFSDLNQNMEVNLDVAL